MQIDHKNTLWQAEEIENATRGYWIVKPGDAWSIKMVSYDADSVRTKKHLIIARNPYSWDKTSPDDSVKLPQMAHLGLAAGAIIQEEQRKIVDQLPSDFPVYCVPSTRLALRDLGIASRNRFQGKVIALTGTVGKTTTREMIRHILAKQGRTKATRGNNNNLAGVSRTMSYVASDDNYAVIEFGFGRPLNGIQRSAKFVRPHIALITQLGLAHLSVFPNKYTCKKTGLQLITEHKAMIFDHMAPDGTAILNRDMSNYPEALQLVKNKKVPNIITYGKQQDAEIRLKSCESNFEQSHVHIVIDGQSYHYTLNVPGTHDLENSLAALAVSRAVGANLERAIKDIETFLPVGGRSKFFEISTDDNGTATLIDGSFNATPDSVTSILKLMSSSPRRENPRRIAILGDILHLGSDEINIHKQLSDVILETGVDLLFTIGKRMQHLSSSVSNNIKTFHTETLEELYKMLRKHFRTQDIIAIKASTPLDLQSISYALRHNHSTFKRRCIPSQLFFKRYP